MKFQNTVEVDLSLRAVAKKLDISLQTVYFEYNRAVRGQKKPFVEASNSSSGQDYLMTYIIGLREGKEIFLQECLFQDEAKNDPTTSVVFSALENTLPEETQKMHELRFEEISQGKNTDVLLRELKNMIHHLNQANFRKLQKLYAHDLMKFKELLELGKKHHLV